MHPLRCFKCLLRLIMEMVATLNCAYRPVTKANEWHVLIQIKSTTTIPEKYISVAAELYRRDLATRAAGGRVTAAGDALDSAAKAEVEAGLATYLASRKKKEKPEWV